jgi:hypothetical protein
MRRSAMSTILIPPDSKDAPLVYLAGSRGGSAKKLGRSVGRSFVSSSMRRPSQGRGEARPYQSFVSVYPLCRRNELRGATPCIRACSEADRGERTGAAIGGEYSTFSTSVLRFEPRAKRRPIRPVVVREKSYRYRFSFKVCIYSNGPRRKHSSGTRCAENPSHCKVTQQYWCQL